jgi:hypothetical protein
MADGNDYRIGKPFDISGLRKPKVGRKPSPRDAAITRAINAAAVAPESQVIPLLLPEGEKVGTATAAARRLIKALNSPVNVGVKASHPNTLLFSRGVLRGRGSRAPRRADAATHKSPYGAFDGGLPQ